MKKNIEVSTEKRSTLLRVWDTTGHSIVAIVIIRFALMLSVVGATEKAPVALVSVMYTMAVIASYALVLMCAVWLVLLVACFAASAVSKIPKDKRIKVKK